MGARCQGAESPPCIYIRGRSRIRTRTRIPRCSNHFHLTARLQLLLLSSATNCTLLLTDMLATTRIFHFLFSFQFFQAASA